jgi:hypothetical protein
MPGACAAFVTCGERARRILPVGPAHFVLDRVSAVSLGALGLAFAMAWRGPGTSRSRPTGGALLGLACCALGSALSPSFAALASIQCAAFAAFGWASARVVQGALLTLVLLVALGADRLSSGVLVVAWASLLVASVPPDPSARKVQRVAEAVLLRAPFVALLAHAGAGPMQVLALVAAAVAGAQRECAIGPRPEQRVFDATLRVFARAAADTEQWVVAPFARGASLGLLGAGRMVTQIEDRASRGPGELLGRLWLSVAARRLRDAKGGTRRGTDDAAS